MSTSNKLKPVTFLLPEHIANLIEETRGHVVDEWEGWVMNTALQCLEHDTVDLCIEEFEDLMVDGSFNFDDAEDRRQFVAPLHKALAKAWEAEQALRGTAVVS